MSVGVEKEEETAGLPRAQEPTIESKWREQLIGLAYGGLAGGHAKRFEIGGVWDYFWFLKPPIIMVGTKPATVKAYAIDAEMKPAELTITAVLDPGTCGCIITASKRRVTPSEIGLTQEKLEQIVRTVLRGEEYRFDAFVNRCSHRR
jgi:hypothetical protein